MSALVGRSYTENVKYRVSDPDLDAKSVTFPPCMPKLMCAICVGVVCLEKD